ncbi:MAG: hypothetical protein GXY44_11195 [Phycisphaerales bacterium]|nr:hypothetical protein [Phycisphaerales bacterium]
MTKNELIEQIRSVNRSAQIEFLESFTQDELLAYLHQLKELERERHRIELMELVAAD